MAEAQGPGDGLGGLEILGSFLSVHFDEFVKGVPKKALGEHSTALILRAKLASVAAKTFVDWVGDFVGVMTFKEVVRLVAACKLFHGTLLELPAGTWIRDGSVDGTHRKIFQESDGDPDQSSDGEAGPQKESYQVLTAKAAKIVRKRAGASGWCQRLCKILECHLKTDPGEREAD